MPVESETAAIDGEVKVDRVGRGPGEAARVVAEEVLVPAQHPATQLGKGEITHNVYYIDNRRSLSFIAVILYCCICNVHDTKWQATAQN